ncbi:cytochrome P450 [Microthyrium microscopicum]|uniref:Cytochrome P450 n=1 Tax=Microthyrium microscopicum TaxID=703497 RepID=A0A6A6U362_9PEZI|nr:cytochrome P450 [Microthyrium microscopicum]
MLFSLSNVVNTSFAVVSITVLYHVCLWVYNWLLHPLSKIPGPLLWGISETPFNLSMINGTFVHDVHKIHQKYGPVVRIAPNELSFITEQAQRDIYSRRVEDGYPMRKDPNFNSAAPNGAFPISSAPKEDHIRQRRALAHGFSEKALSEQEPLIRKHVDLLMTKLQNASSQNNGTTVLDIGKYFNFAIFDIFGDLGFGESFNCLVEERYHKWTTLLPYFPKAGLMAKSLKGYGILSPLLMLLLVPKQVISGAKDHWNLCVEKVNQRFERTTNRKDIMSYILKNKDNKSDTFLSVPELEATGYILIFAGAETTASNLSATISYLVRYPAKFAKLRDEIRSQFSAAEDISFRNTTATHLPYMHAVIQESMRLAPPVAGNMPRVVPEGGGTIDDQMYPGGTIVGTAVYATQRSAMNFTYPNSFIPERWLNTNHPNYTCDSSDPPFGKETFVTDQKGAAQPFSVGPRNCIGMNLAMAEIRLVLALFIFNFNVSSPAGTEPMVWEDQKTYNNWVRTPMDIEISLAKSKS